MAYIIAVLPMQEQIQDWRFYRKTRTEKLF